VSLGFSSTTHLLTLLKFNDMKNWDCKKMKFVKQSKALEAFFNEIAETCKKHGYSISHEDGHGSFQIEYYHDDYIDWLRGASLRLSER
jgi:hypothetical protein